MLPEKILKVTKKITYAIGILIATILLAMLIIPNFFKDQINNSIKEIANKNINGELEYSDINLSFFTHFPSLTTSIHNVKVKGSAPFRDSTLIDVKEISLGLDFFSLFKDKFILNKFIISDGKINILIDSTGAANYNIYANTDSSTTTDSTDASPQIAFKLLKLQNIDLRYQDASLPMLIEAKNFNYIGKGDLMSSNFALETDATIEAFSFAFDNEKYVDQKSLHAHLITQINTNNLSFIFEKNDILINKLPVRFRGSFAFLSNGYDLNFKLKSQESTLRELLSLVPKTYAEWLENTKIKGTSEVFMNLEGKYIAEHNLMPDLTLGIIINDGYLSYKDSKIPVSDLNAKVRVDFPKFNLDSLSIDLKQFEFKLAEGYFNTIGKIQGLNPMEVDYSSKISLNLGSFSQAIQWPTFDLAGQFDFEAEVHGKYATDTLTYGIRNQKQTYIASIPKFTIKNSLKNGYFKFTDLPAAIEKIAYTLEATGTDNQIKNAKIAIKDIDIKSLNNFIKGHADIKDFQKLHLDANVQANIDLTDIKKVYPIDSVDIAGNVFVNIISQGFMDLSKNIIPETSATISMRNGYFKTWEYPLPIEEINVETHINSKTGSLKDLNVKILPISFLIAGEPFFLNADFQNFNNIKYAIKSKGKLNLEPIYKIFAIEGTNVNGYIQTDIDLAGLQSDAIQGKFNRLKNEGNVEIRDINITTELLPQTVKVKNGKFSFRQEKLNFDNVITQYGNNEITIKGFINNIINYLTTNIDVLKGKFDIRSEKLNINDFMAFNLPQESTTSNNVNSGVVLLPNNLDIEALGFANQVYFDDILLKNFKGNLKLKDGKLDIKNTGFELAGLKADMNIHYRALNANKAKFDFNVKANDFDIQRAYNEIPLFKEMVTSAKNAHGLVSLDYKLAGLLDDQMSPIMSSIQGNGVLILEKIKFLNFKLLNGISKETDKDGFLKADVKKVKINTSIKNNVMTIERTKMKMAGFRPRFEGQVTLDGKMNLGFRLGLPPFGIFGIPMKITGTADNFKIKLGRYKEEDLDTDMDEEDKALYEKSLMQDTVKTN